MAREKKYQNVVANPDSDDEAGAVDRRRVELSEEADDLSSSSDVEDQSEASSFPQSGDESELSEFDDDHNHQQSENHHTDEDASESSSSSKGCRPGGDDGVDDDTLRNRVVQLLQEERDIGKLKLVFYKAYLRKHGLRISGNKAECLSRIHEHWRLKDGKGEAFYPSSSFVINCTGDVCKGDVVKFRQTVYQKFDKLTRSGKVLGSRTIAGRVVKESYGAAKQQHTFTVEVLWSKGTNNLPPLFPLLIKGRNLYRLKTFRQPWKNEAERSKALDEKHGRGAIARQKREVRIQRRKIARGARTLKPAIRQEKLTCGGNKASTSKSYPDVPYQQFDALQVQSDYRNAQFAGRVPSSAFMGPSSAVYSGSQSRHQPPGSCAPYQQFHGPQLQSDYRNAQFAFPRRSAPSSSAIMEPSAVVYSGSQFHHPPPGSYAPYQGFHRLQVQSDFRNAFPRGCVPSSAIMGPSALGHYGSQFHRQPLGSYAPYQQFPRLQVRSNSRNAQFAFPIGSVPSSSAIMGPSAVGYSGSQSHHQPSGSYSYSSEHFPPTEMPLRQRFTQVSTSIRPKDSSAAQHKDVRS